MNSRREFLAKSASVALATQISTGGLLAAADDKSRSGISIEMPRCRVPLSFIIDDSTCLVNMGKFCMPQFSATYPERKDYQLPWRDWPSEIPDAFVREFGSWCAEQGVKGKYSIVPYPACVGWMDRTLPGWSQQELKNSLKLVRDLMVPNWDIHPEMITHTRVIDLKTGRPFADNSPKHMENSYPQQDVSVDYLASYLAYALRILKNCDLPCEGITTPGGFGTRVREKLPHATFEAVRDVYGTEIPHYFKYVSNGDESTEPKIEALRDEQTDSPQLCMNVPAGTGDWFGGWEGASTSDPDRYCNEDATSGRMVELIQQKRPAVMLCHWPGMYCNGSLQGYHDFQRVVLSLDRRFKDETLWMKVSDIGKYWAAKELTEVKLAGTSVSISAPFACTDFTVRIPLTGFSKVVVETSDSSQVLGSVSTIASLTSGSCHIGDNSTTVCFSLPKGESSLHFS